VTKFSEFPFPEVLQQNLVEAGYVSPTPIQARCILPALEGKDILGLAQTGTGKTAAFALPIITRLAQSMELGALILAPTRELVQQIVVVFRMLGKHTGIRVASVVGGVDYMIDTKALRSWPNVLVATPGRLIDHMEQKDISLAAVETFVIDEADRMHDMGFIPQVRRIIAALPEKRQTLMFTATMPEDVEQVINRSMHNPVRIQVGLAVPVDRATQAIYHVSEESKTDLLREILKKETGRVLIFVRTKRGVDRLAPKVSRTAGPIARLHGDREQEDRDEAMGGFREGRYKVLIATDIAARGLDVANIEHVINYDFPRSSEDYVHRIGRTARLAAKGRATSFVTSIDRRQLAEVEHLIGSKIPVAMMPGVATSEHAVAASAEDEGHGGRRHGGGKGRGRAGGGSGGRRGGSGGRGGRSSHAAEGSRGHKPASPGAESSHEHKPASPGAESSHEHKPASPGAESSHEHKPAAHAGHAAEGAAAGAEAGAPKKRRRRRSGRGKGQAGAPGAEGSAPAAQPHETPHAKPHAAHPESPAKDHGGHPPAGHHA
jgi:ATP-dependent RNA helicase RhlE